MKVIHLISGGDTGGAKTHVLSLLHGLNQTDTAQLVCFRDGEFAQEAREMGIPTEIFAGNNLPRTVRSLADYIRAGGYQIIHCHGSRANMVGALLKYKTGLPIVTTVHSDYRLDYMGRLMGRLTYGTINTIALRCFDYHIGVSDAMVDLLIGRGFRPDRFYAIYNGLLFDARRTLPDRVAYLRGLGANAEADSVVVGIAARLNPVKDIATLIRGFAKAAAACPRLRLVIAGDGQERQTLGRLAEELDVADKVCFAGWISDMDSFYQALDINTLTSVSETFPYALTEGSRYRLPTISSRVGGVPYLIDHGVNGFLFPAGNADRLGEYLLQLAEDEELRHTMGEALYQKASEKFSLAKTIETQKFIYSEILRRSQRPRQKRDGVVICGAYGRNNAGDDAILEAILTEMRAIDPDTPLTVLSRRPKETRLTYRVPAVHSFNIVAWWRAMGRSRLYINGGGSLIQDITSTRSLLYYLVNIRTAARRGNKVLMYGCGIGPVGRPANRRSAARIINRYVDAITLREPSSLEELKKMGVTKPDIRLSADPALILPPAADTAVDSALASAGVPLEGSYICFAIRKWKNIEAAFPALRAAATYAYERHGLTPLFLAVEQVKDPEIIRQLAQGLTVPHYTITDPANHRTVIGLLRRMKLVVSMRLHSLIFAAGQGVPLIGLVYDPKVSAFLEYIGQDLYLDISSMDESSLCRLIDVGVARGSDPSGQASVVDALLTMEQVNSRTAAELLAQTGNR